jgi:hypothetical protein
VIAAIEVVALALPIHESALEVSGKKGKERVGWQHTRTPWQWGSIGTSKKDGQSEKGGSKGRSEIFPLGVRNKKN